MLSNPNEIVNFVFAQHPSITAKTPARLAFIDHHDVVVKAYSTRLRWAGRFGSVSVADARKTPALQAADIVAYEFETRTNPVCFRTVSNPKTKTEAHLFLRLEFLAVRTLLQTAPR